MLFYFRGQKAPHRIVSVEITSPGILRKLPVDLPETADGWFLVLSEDESDFCMWVVDGADKYVIEKEGKAVALCNEVPDDWLWLTPTLSGVFATMVFDEPDLELEA